MTGDSLVSVIIPCFRQAAFLGEAIESVLSQSPTPEVIVVDDESPDETSVVAARYPGVRYVRQANRGVAEARNSGARMSSGQFLVFLDADDRLLPGSIEAHLLCFREAPESGFVYGRSEWFDDSGTYPVPVGFHAGQDAYEDLLHTRYIGMHGAIMFTRDAFEGTGGYRGEYSPCEDYELELAVARRLPVAAHSTVVASHRVHRASASRDVGLMMRQALKVLRSQRQFVQGNPARTRALELGLRKCRERYWLGLAALLRDKIRRPGELSYVVKHLPVLVLYAPAVLSRLLARQIVRRSASA